MDDLSVKIKQFFSEYKLIGYKSKEVIIHQSDEPTGVYFLKSGFVKMNTILKNGNELTLNIFKPGSFFPMTWALADSPNNYVYQALTDVSLYKASRKGVVNFLKENPDVLYDLTKRVLSGLDGFLVNMTYLVIGGAASRVSSAIIVLSKRFGKVTRGRKITINIRLTHQDIANISGLTREATSVEISKLQKRKIILQTGGRIVIKDLEKLKNETELEEGSVKQIITI
jgi:CRP-like cAMP-binding protein